jgi:hypothetical protein
VQVQGLLLERMIAHTCRKYYFNIRREFKQDFIIFNKDVVNILLTVLSQLQQVSRHREQVPSKMMTRKVTTLKRPVKKRITY